MNKKIAAITGLVILALGITGYFFYSKHARIVPVNIISADRKIPIQDVKMFLSGFPMQSASEDPRKFFSKEIINAYTVRFFKFIQTEISYTTREEHLKAVKEYLRSVLDPGKADEIFALYERFLDYEVNLKEKAKSWSNPRNSEELLRYLKAVQDYRREVFGSDVADAMWGAEVKANEYSIRKNEIKTDPNLYGAEKEKKINSLKEDMWGDDASLVEESPLSDPEKFASYQEKQVIYQKDLRELTEDQRVERIKKFRNELFSPEQVTRLEQVDEQIQAEKMREADYFTQEAAIKNDSSMDNDKKAQAIRDLQDRIFEDDAEAFRRRLNIKDSMDMKGRR